MKIPPWLSLALRISTAVLAIIITAAQGAPDRFGGKVIADDITFWLGLAVTIVNTVFSFLGTGTQPSATLIGRVV